MVCRIYGVVITRPNIGLSSIVKPIMKNRFQWNLNQIKIMFLQRYSKMLSAKIRLFFLRPHVPIQNNNPSLAQHTVRLDMMKVWLCNIQVHIRGGTIRWAMIQYVLRYTISHITRIAIPIFLIYSCDKKCSGGIAEFPLKGQVIHMIKIIMFFKCEITQ